jgi:hypothetical protein
VAIYRPPALIDPQSHPVSFRGAGFDDDKYVYHYTRWERLLDIGYTGVLFGSLAAVNDPRE